MTNKAKEVSAEELKLIHEISAFLAEKIEGKNVKMACDAIVTALAAVAFISLKSDGKEVLEYMSQVLYATSLTPSDKIDKLTAPMPIMAQQINQGSNK